MLFVPPLVTFLGTLVADEVNANASVEFIGARRQFGGQLQLPSCPFLARFNSQHALSVAKAMTPLNK